MINRELIRLKVLQITYAFYQNGDKDVRASEKELLFSMSKAYELYIKLLSLIVALHQEGHRRLEILKQSRMEKQQAIAELEAFTGNLFAIQLEKNVHLCSFLNDESNRWDNDAEFVRRLFGVISTSDMYKTYVESVKKQHDYEEDKEFWRMLYRLFIGRNRELDAILEEKCLYWNDDKEIIDTFVQKTIKGFEQKQGTDQKLLQDYYEGEEKDFACRLFRCAVNNEEEYRGYMKDASQNWELDRIAIMDIIIMQMAIAEMINFPNIPLGVTINMYVMLALLYSTEKSSKFINGMLDQIARELIEKRKILKSIDD